VAERGEEIAGGVVVWGDVVGGVAETEPHRFVQLLGEENDRAVSVDGLEEEAATVLGG